MRIRVEYLVILTDKKIETEIKQGAISINPFYPEQLNPNSYDVRLFHTLKVYKPKTLWDRLRQFFGLWSLDPAEELATEDIEIPEEGFVLKPGVVYLASTEEVIQTDKYVTVLDGKSSIGRLGLAIHVTAGYIDAGFNGQVTLELKASQPVRVYRSMRIGQLRYHVPEGEITLYEGNYKYRCTGPVPSQAHRQIALDRAQKRMG